MAIWQYSLHSVPVKKDKTFFSLKEVEELLVDIKTFFGEEYSNSNQYIRFGNVESDDCSISFEDNIVDYISFRLDITKLSHKKLKSFCELMKKWNLILYDSEEKEVLSNYDSIVESIKLSRGARFLLNAEEYLKEIKQSPIKD